MVDQFQINRRKEFLTPSLHFIQFIRICASSAFIGPTLSDVINKSVALLVFYSSLLNLGFCYSFITVWMCGCHTRIAVAKSEICLTSSVSN